MKIRWETYQLIQFPSLRLCLLKLRTLRWAVLITFLGNDLALFSKDSVFYFLNIWNCVHGRLCRYYSKRMNTIWQYTIIKTASVWPLSKNVFQNEEGEINFVSLYLLEFIFWKENVIKNSFNKNHVGILYLLEL